jgi:hypothetical protein
MSTLALAPLTRDRVHGEPTLDDLLVGVWEGLSARRAVRCPVCTAEMEPVQYAAEPVRGRCEECGAGLS